MSKALTKRDRGHLTVAVALGKVHVLAVGVSEYQPRSNFPNLRQCNHDAAIVKARFEAKWQLNADTAHVRQLTSEGSDKPSKGNIMAALRQLASDAGPEERVLFYFSGHGYRLKDKLYLVPGDAWTDDDPDALLAYDKVVEVISNSQAKVKIVILDACMSGPDLTHVKHPAAQLSEKFLAEYIDVVVEH